MNRRLRARGGPSGQQRTAAASAQTRLSIAIKCGDVAVTGPGRRGWQHRQTPNPGRKGAGALLSERDAAFGDYRERGE